MKTHKGKIPYWLLTGLMALALSLSLAFPATTLAQRQSNYSDVDQYASAYADADANDLANGFGGSDIAVATAVASNLAVVSQCNVRSFFSFLLVGPC